MIIKKIDVNNYSSTQRKRGDHTNGIPRPADAITFSRVEANRADRNTGPAIGESPKQRLSNGADIRSVVITFIYGDALPPPVCKSQKE